MSSAGRAVPGCTESPAPRYGRLFRDCQALGHQVVNQLRAQAQAQEMFPRALAG